MLAKVLALSIVIGCFQLSSAVAQDAESIDRLSRERLHGWKYLAVRCSPMGEISWQKDTCDFIKSDINLLLEQNSIAGSYCANCDWFNFHYRQLKSNIDDYLTLDIKFRTTEDGMAGTVNLSAGMTYSAAVDQGALLTSSKGVPRSGYLELWSSFVAFHGTNVTPADLGPYIVNDVKDLVVYLLKARRKS